MDNLITVTVVFAVIVFLLLTLGYYYLFVFRSKGPVWKKDIEVKLRALYTKNLDKEHMIIQLDKLLEHALKNQYNMDQSLGAILKAKKSKFTRSDLNQIWTAHKLRNKLVHDINYEASPNELNQSVIVFKQTINKIIK